MFVLETPDLAALDLSDEAEPHLREVIEREPVALARVSKDGTLLAVNEAGQSMFGAGSLEQILGTSLPELSIPEQRESFHAFLNVVADGDCGSFEVDLVGLTGKPHTLDIRARRHPGAPDAIPSALLTFHDVSSLRRLEQTLEEAARLFQQDDMPSRERLKDLRERFEAVQAERRDLLASSALLRVEAKFHRHTVDDQLSRLESLESSRAQALGTANELQAALDERAAQVVELSARVHQLDEERRQAEESAAELRRTLESHEARSNELTARVEELEAEAARQLDAVHAAETAQLARLVELEEAHVAQVRELEAAHAARVAALEQSLTDERQVHQRRITQFEQAASAGAGTSAEVAILTVRLAEMEAAHATSVSELAVAHAARVTTMQRSLADQQRAHEHRISELEQSAASRLADAEQSHAGHLARVETAHVEQHAALEAALQQSETARHESQSALKESQSALQESQNALTESEATLAEAVARTEAAVEEGRRADAASAVERQRLEAALQAATESDREARQLLAAEVATRTEVQRRKTSLLDAISRLGQEARRIEGDETEAHPDAADQEEGR